MFTLNGKYNTAKVYTDVIEQEAISQIINICNQKAFEGSQIRIMPDVHAGKGCTIGTTMTIKDKVVPNLVGVDIGCLDADTEILTPNGWIRITNYNNEDILMYDRYTDIAHFEKPLAYIKDKCDTFYHFYAQNGLDQMLSAEHKMLLWRGYKGKGYQTSIEDAKIVFEKHNARTKSNIAIKTTFGIENTTCRETTDMIRLFVMIQADGRIRYNKSKTKSYIALHFRKQRKIDRAIQLIKNVGYTNTYYKSKDGTSYINFTADKYITKSLYEMCGIMNNEQSQAFIDEIFKWDGTIDEKRDHHAYTTANKSNADYVQFVFASQGIRAGIQRVDYNKTTWNTSYRVYTTKNAYVGFPNRKFNKVASSDGYKYCFTTTTGYFIIRRNNNISITGNCGMGVCRLDASDMDFKKLDTVIRKHVPSGFNIRNKAHNFIRNIDLKQLRCYEYVKENENRIILSLGTLGGGNHFIEVDKNDDGMYYLIIHSGSRHLGVAVANYYQKAAYRDLSKHFSKDAQQNIIARCKAEGRPDAIQSELQKLTVEHIPRDFAYCEGQLFDDYIHDMKIVQEYATQNRLAMLDEILTNMGISATDTFTTIHNYIDTENMILRKGAVSAQTGEKLIIPINMRDGSLICTGKGNEDWNCSAPHGAGRLMSRSKAKESISLEDFEASMEGIFTTSVGRGTLDESPMAYKSINDILDNIGDTVTVDEIIKPVYNFKASE